MKIYILFLMTCLCSSTFADVIRMPPKQSEEDASHSYIKAALELALQETEKDYGLTTIEFLKITYNQRLMFTLLNYKGVLDVVASAPSPDREVRYRSAHVPLLKGLLGYRMMVIRNDDQGKFSKIKTIDELKALTACQGAHWPDTIVLEHNGFKVKTAHDFQDLFILLMNKECDYFPRSITEGYGEIEAFNLSHQNTTFVAFDDILLHYIQPFLFYTSHENFELAARLEKGLKQAVKKGKLMDLMKTHEVTKHIFPLEKWKGKKIFELENPITPKSLPTEEKDYWIKL